MPVSSITFAYDGASTVTATITGDVGDSYTLNCYDGGGAALGTADTDVGPSCVLVVSDVAGFTGDSTFAALVTDSVIGTNYGVEVFQNGSTLPYNFGAAFVFDGVEDIQVTYPSVAARYYELDVFAPTGTGFVSDTGTGGSQTLDCAGCFGGAPLPGECALAWLIDNNGSVYEMRAAKIFAGGVAGSGSTICDAFPGDPVVTLDATAITRSSAQLNATGNPEGVATVGYFEWGPTAAYGNQTTPQALGSGSAAVPFDDVITGLDRFTVYHFRAVTEPA